MSLPTSFVLPDEAVDRGTLLRASSALQKLLARIRELNEPALQRPH